jgi:glucan phosphoethanolaminetransferase (alkaline phosphatase superfamily)
MSAKQKISYTIQIAYELLCFGGALVIVTYIKETPAKTIPYLFIPLLFFHLLGNSGAKKLTYSLAIAFLAYLTWTIIVTFYLTNYLENSHIIGEHSIWDTFAFLIPFVLTIWTFIWSIKKRTPKNRFETVYLICVIVILLIFTNCITY